MRLFTVLSLAAAMTIAMPLFAEEPAAEKGAVTHVDAKAAAELRTTKDEKKKPVVLDIRTPCEFKEGHLEGAKNIDFRAKDFEAKLAELDKDKPYVVH